MRFWRHTTAIVAAFAAALALSACADSSSRKGSVSVLYAGSLQALMDNQIGPAFAKATGYTFNGYPAGSKDLASEIKGKVRAGDVFISASPKVDQSLSGRANGGWVSWYVPFASTRLVLGYNPSSGHAHELRTQPWYRVIARPGLRLGFTDPTLDPKGALTVAALHRAAAAYHLPALNRLAADQSDLFPEQDLVGRLQAGQLDAGFFYTVEAKAAHIPTVSLSPVDESATYTITVLNRAPNPKGARAFVKFLLGDKGRALMRSAGLRTGAVGFGVPAWLRGTISVGG